MRRKDWDHAISLLRKAEKLEPKMAGIRLNIGLVEYRRGNYDAAIAPLSSVLRNQPDSQQARYLLGLCQVFTKKYAEAVTVLEPLWPEKSGDVLYLYLIDIAAVESGQKELDEKILSRMIAVGGGTPEFHLIMGKAFLNRYEVGEAKAELNAPPRGIQTFPSYISIWVSRICVPVNTSVPKRSFAAISRWNRISQTITNSLGCSIRACKGTRTRKNHSARRWTGMRRAPEHTLASQSSIRNRSSHNRP
jgi:tetratricopeptide (TPR) repeat protein